MVSRHAGASSPTEGAGRTLTEEMVFMRTKCNRLDLIKNLNLWGNDLRNINIIRLMPNLEVLSLSVNSVGSLAALRGCPKLTELYLRKNVIRDLTEVHHLVNLRHLRVLWLSDNPCAHLPAYRQYVLHHLPQIHKLDSQDVTQDERQEAQRLHLAEAQTCFDDIESEASRASEDEAPPARHRNSAPAHATVRPAMQAEPRQDVEGRRYSVASSNAEVDMRRDRRHHAPDSTPTTRCSATLLPAQVHRAAEGESFQYGDDSPEQTPRGDINMSPIQQPPALVSERQLQAQAQRQARQAYAEPRGVWQERPAAQAQAQGQAPPRSAWQQAEDPQAGRRLPARRGSGEEAPYGDEMPPPGGALRHHQRPAAPGQPDNVLCAVLALIKELDRQGLELVRRGIEQRLCEP